VHRYAFQLFALLPGDAFSSAPGRKELATAIRQRGIASGCFIGTYQREETVGLRNQTAPAEAVAGGIGVAP
jgi:hypothetical protein